MFRDSAPRGRISKQNITQAAAGSIPHVLYIARDLTPDTCTVAIVEMAFSHIGRGDAGGTFSMQGATVSLGGAGAILLLSVVGVIIKGAQGRIRALVVTRLNEHAIIDALSHQLRELMHDPTLGTILGFRRPWQGDVSESVLSTCLAFHIFWTLDASIPPMFVSSTAFMDAMIRLWMDPVKAQGKVLFLELDPVMLRGEGNPGCPCPLLTLLAGIFNTDQGKAVFLETVESRGRIHELPQTIWRRAQQIRRGLKRGEWEGSIVSPVSAHCCLAIFLDIFHDIPGSTRRPAIDSKCIRVLTSAANTASSASLSRPGPPGETSTAYIAAHLFFETLLKKVLARSDPRDVINWKEALSGGLVDLAGGLSELARRGSDSQSDAHSLGEMAMECLSVYSTYPDVLREILRMNGASGRQATLGTTWKTLWTDVIQPRSLVYVADQETPLSICDNITCTRTEATPNVRPKRCSGCFSAVYCSTACQKDDWKRFHSQECIHALSEYQGRDDPASIPWYKPSWRSFHTKLAADALNQGLWEEYPAKAGEFVRKMIGPFPYMGPWTPTTAPGVVPLIIFNLGLKPSLQAKLVAMGLYQKVGQPYLLNRYNGLLRANSEGTLPPCTRLVEAQFVLVSRATVLLTMVMRVVDGKFVPRYTAWRWFTNKALKEAVEEEQAERLRIFPEFTTPESDTRPASACMIH